MREELSVVLKAQKSLAVSLEVSLEGGLGNREVTILFSARIMVSSSSSATRLASLRKSLTVRVKSRFFDSRLLHLER